MNVIEEIKKKFAEKADIFEKSKKRVYVTVAKRDTKEIVKFLYEDLGARFSIATGIDTSAGVELLYHMAFDKLGLMVSVRTLVPKPELEIASFSDFCAGALWIEREIHEMLGVDFIGHPGLERLLLPDDWPAGTYPFRKKTFESEREGIEREE